MTRPVVLIDNLDSFSFNLVEAFQRLGSTVRVLRNAVSATEALAMAQALGALLVLSPGPGDPNGAGCCLELVSLAKGNSPLLGICLGHQAIVQEAGGRVERAPEPVHGKVSLMAHDGQGPFAGLPGPMRIGRYHSLCTTNLPRRFTVHAEVDGVIMAISDADALQVGLQFHPESILTTYGDALLRAVLTGLSPTGQP
jgi:anthranilate synthase/aminodeoxychorismate synthase-like glutamine amidotransferase